MRIWIAKFFFVGSEKWLGTTPREEVTSLNLPGLLGPNLIKKIGSRCSARLEMQFQTALFQSTTFFIHFFLVTVFSNNSIFKKLKNKLYLTVSIMKTSIVSLAGM